MIRLSCTLARLTASTVGLAITIADAARDRRRRRDWWFV